MVATALRKKRHDLADGNIDKQDSADALVADGPIEDGVATDGSLKGAQLQDGQIEDGPYFCGPDADGIVSQDSR